MATVISTNVTGGNNLEVDDDFTKTSVLPNQITCQVTLNGNLVPPTNTVVQGTVKKFSYNNLANGVCAVHVVDPTQTVDKPVPIPQ
jgi:hypothetical protein